MKILILKGKTLQNTLGLRLQLVAVVGNENIHSMRIIIAGVVALSIAQLNRANRLTHFRGNAHGNLQHRAVGGVSCLLRQITDKPVFIHDNLALIRGVLPQNHAEKGGFTGAVGAYQGNALAPVNDEFRLKEQGASGVGFCQFLDGQHARIVYTLFSELQSIFCPNPWDVECWMLGVESNALSISC